MAKAQIKKPKAVKKTKDDASFGRGLWKGSIAFGLVNIPVYLKSAQQSEKLHFRMLDKKNFAPIGYRQINKQTEKEVSRQNIVKAFEYEKDQFVVMTDADFNQANVKATRTIEIEDFVFLEEVDPMLFEKPYYVLPQKGGEKGYVLLRDTLRETKKAGVAKIVLHKVQHLAALMPREDYIILEMLRFADEIRDVTEMKELSPAVRAAKVSDRELQVAEQLVEGMSSKWNPEKYRNTYREDIMKLVKAKIRRGTGMHIEEPAKDDASSEMAPSNVLDLTSLLKKSLDAASNRPKKAKRGA